jgi:broad specificity phosphatase PhoE
VSGLAPVDGPDVLWFVRHGESEGNARADAAHLPWPPPDIPLTDLGVRQARALGRWFGRQEPAPTAVLVSPYVRARATAAALLGAGGPALAALPVAADPRLRDRDADEEPWPDVVQRVRDVLGDLAGATGQRLLVVAHDAVVQAARGVLTGLDAAALLGLVRTPYPNAGLATFVHTPTGYACTTYGWTVPVEPADLSS